MRRILDKLIDILPARNGIKMAHRMNRTITLLVTLVLPWLISASHVVSGTKQSPALTEVTIQKRRRGMLNRCSTNIIQSNVCKIDAIKKLTKIGRCDS